MTVAVPAFTPTTFPYWSTVTTFVFEDFHVTVDVALLSLSLVCFPFCNDKDVALIETGFAVTVNLQEYVFPS